jgi:HTH-type transcriptional regulator/antitoxin HigA
MHLDSNGLATVADLARDLKYFGSRARVSEALDRKRAITMEMIRNLHRGQGIPAQVLIQPYRTAREIKRLLF